MVEEEVVEEEVVGEELLLVDMFAGLKRFLTNVHMTSIYME